MCLYYCTCNNNNNKIVPFDNTFPKSRVHTCMGGGGGGGGGGVYNAPTCRWILGFTNKYGISLGSA